MADYDYDDTDDYFDLDQDDDYGLGRYPSSTNYCEMRGLTLGF